METNEHLAQQYGRWMRLADLSRDKQEKKYARERAREIRKKIMEEAKNAQAKKKPGGTPGETGTRGK